MVLNSPIVWADRFVGKWRAIGERAGLTRHGDRTPSTSIGRSVTDQDIERCGSFDPPLGAAQDLDLVPQPVPEPILLDFQVRCSLEIQLRRPRKLPAAAPQSQGRVGGDRPHPTHDLVDPARRDARIPGQTVLTEAERVEEFFLEDLAGMDRRELAKATCGVPRQ